MIGSVGEPTEDDTMPTERQERQRTINALDRINTWGQVLAAGGSPDGGENITFSLVRNGAVADYCLADGDCTPYTAAGGRGLLRGQPAGFNGEPQAHFILTGTGTLDTVDCSFEFDLNNGHATVQGTFPNGVAASFGFDVEYLDEFEGGGGKNIVFVSRHSTDKAGYVLTVQLVAA